MMQKKIRMYGMLSAFLYCGMASAQQQQQQHTVEMIPFGLLAGFVDDKEVRITEISTESFCFRVREQVERPRHIRIGFYDLSESMYREVELESYHFMEKRQEQWYISYTVEVFQQDYVQAVQKLFREYTGYIRARIEGTD